MPGTEGPKATDRDWLPAWRPDSGEPEEGGYQGQGGLWLRQETNSDEQCLEQTNQQNKESVDVDAHTIMTLIVVPAAGALSAAVIALWRQSNALHIRTSSRLEQEVDECEASRGKQHDWAIAISERVGNLEGTVNSQARSQEQIIQFCDDIVERLDKF